MFYIIVFYVLIAILNWLSFILEENMYVKYYGIEPSKLKSKSNVLMSSFAWPIFILVMLALMLFDLFNNVKEKEDKDE